MEEVNKHANFWQLPKWSYQSSYPRVINLDADRVYYSPLRPAITKIFSRDRISHRRLFARLQSFLISRRKREKRQIDRQIDRERERNKEREIPCSNFYEKEKINRQIERKKERDISRSNFCKKERERERERDRDRQIDRERERERDPMFKFLHEKKKDKQIDRERERERYLTFKFLQERERERWTIDRSIRFEDRRRKREREREREIPCSNFYMRK